ncbi:TMEM214 family protein [Megaselia abdita]
MAPNNKANKNKQNKQNKKGNQDNKSSNSKKRTVKKSSSSCCKYLLGSFVLIGAIGALIAYDTQVIGNGVFEKSATGKWLKKAGLLPYVESAWYKTMAVSARGYQWAEKNLPVYLKPAFDLSCDLLKIIRNAVFNIFEKLRELVSTNAPGVALKLEEVYSIVSTKTIEIFNITREYLAANVFV